MPVPAFSMPLFGLALGLLAAGCAGRHQPQEGDVYQDLAFAGRGLRDVRLVVVSTQEGTVVLRSPWSGDNSNDIHVSREVFERRYEHVPPGH